MLVLYRAGGVRVVTDLRPTAAFLRSDRHSSSNETMMAKNANSIDPVRSSIPNTDSLYVLLLPYPDLLAGLLLRDLCPQDCTLQTP
jgi:hypothetical protein